MSKDDMKMIADMAMIIAQADRECLMKSDDCGVCNAWGKEPCACYNEAEILYNEGCRKIGEDEIVIKKDEYMHFLHTRLNELKNHSEVTDGFNQGSEQTKQEIVKKILQELSDEGYKIYEQQGYTFDIGNFYWLITYARRKYEINLEG